MSNDWTRVQIAEDPYWKEWHRTIKTDGGSMILKVWESLSGYWEASLTHEKGGRSIQHLDASTEQAAKNEANRWFARKLLDNP